MNFSGESFINTEKKERLREFLWRVTCDLINNIDIM
jgi:hypothetical protein